MSVWITYDEQTTATPGLVVVASLHTALAAAVVGVSVVGVTYDGAQPEGSRLRVEYTAQPDGEDLAAALAAVAAHEGA